jgi:hypothetical protein
MLWHHRGAWLGLLAALAGGSANCAFAQSAFGDREFTVVPIPLSDPTLGSGLAVVGIHFLPQTPEEAAQQPPSYTGAFAMATSNGSAAGGVMHTQHWDADRWRFSGIAGYGHINLDFFGSGTAAGDRGIGARWTVDATIVQPKLYRSIADDWYLGGQLRYVDAKQTFDFTVGEVTPPEGQNDVTAVGAGLLLERDTRDNQFNAYDGSLLQFDAMFNRPGLGSDVDYDSLTVRWRQYLSLRPDLVLAMDTQACLKTGQVPLFDNCFLSLRGYPATRYIGRSMAMAQAELRWRVAGPVGLVAFIGTGTVASRLGDLSMDGAPVGFGVGVRYLVHEAQRINLRIDVARGGGSNVVYLSVAEAF